jgi:hypothetical protein
MLRRLLPPMAVLVVLYPMLALAGAYGTDAPAGLPITAPDVELQVVGVGHDPEVVPAFDSPTILFTNFDGAQLQTGCGNDSHNDCSTLGGSFGGAILPFTGTHADRAAIVQAVREDVTDFGVIVLGERPAANQNYAMVLVGDGVSGDPAWAGLAPVIDCGNTNPNVTSFALEWGSPNTMATVIHQEAAHTWGLEHVDEVLDNLNPVAGLATNPTYTDACNKIVSNTDLNPSSGQCGSVHTQFCSSGYQNSYREMALLFGAPIPDTVSPGIEFVIPTEGESFACPVSFDLTFTLSDDRKPQSLNLEVYLDGVEVASGLYVDTTLQFPISGGIDPGPHTWTVEITDESGNPASAEVNFTVEDGPECAGDGSAGSP